MTNIKQLAELALDHAKKSGADQAEMVIGLSDGYNAVVRCGEPETVEYANDKSMDITVFVNQQKASASTTDLRESSIKETVEKAVAIAKVMQADSYNGLAPKELMAQDLYDLDLNHPHDIPPKQALELALECEQHAFSLDKRITNSDGVSFSTHSGDALYANSHGFIGEAKRSSFELSCILIAKQGDQLERDYDYDHGIAFHELNSPQNIAAKAVDNTVKRLGARKIKTQKVPVLFNAERAVGLIGKFFSAIAGSKLYRKASFLLDHLGQPIFPEFVTITEKPHIKRGLASTLFDGDGVATFEKDFIKNGVLETYMMSHYSSQRLGLKTTANADGAHNVVMTNSDLDFQAMLKALNTGLFVTELMGHGINMVTGDYSQGARGFWVENGEIQYPVSEITIAGNLKDMFKHIVAIGNDIDKRFSLATGSILIEEMMVAGS